MSIEKYTILRWRLKNNERKEGFIRKIFKYNK